MTYRLAIDMGATSLGWCALDLDEKGDICGILDMGVRIFPDGRDAQSKEPLAVARRGSRGMGRRRDRYLGRRRRLMEYMIETGLMPQGREERKALELKDPYELRARAAIEKVTLPELGRALFHINQRRGFKSNRKADSKDNEGGAIKKGIAELEQAMMAAGVKTLGQFLYEKHKKHEGVLARPETKGQKNEYDFYPAREMYAQEVDFILNKQQSFHSELTDDVCKKLKEIIFYQRPLKPQPVGWCTFENKEKRARLASPAAQRFRILQEVNNLEIDQMEETDPWLTVEDRQKIAEALQNKKEMTFNAIRKLLGLAGTVKFNLEAAENRKGLNGNSTNFLLSKKECFGDAWHDFSAEQQEDIVEFLMKEPDPETVIETLIRDYRVSVEQAEKICDAPLKDGYGRLSLKAIHKILPGLEKGLRYHEACKEAGYHHSDFRTGEVFDRLPYYGQALEAAVIGGTYAEEDKDNPEKYYGKINNPTVHIALNQLRKLVNALIDIYGPPGEVAIELARELKYGRDRLQEHNKEQKKNRERNERINVELEKLGQTPNYKNRLQFKMWEDLSDDPTKRCCPFTGKQIGIHDIFSGEFEIEHLLPFSRSYNDSPANKVLSHRSANRIKGNRSPYEAFGHTPEWSDILARAENLPKNKRWRFKEDAWEIAKGKSEDLIARQLTDTQYMTKKAREYVSFVVAAPKGESRVYGIPGQLTALMRRKWGLNNIFDDDSEKKDRSNHRHHAIDAFVVGCTTRGMLQAASRLNEDDRDKIRMPEPFEGFREQLQDKAEAMVISYKPDHGNARKAAEQGKTVAGLHQETAYGLVGPGDPKKGTMIYVTRKAVSGFTKRKDIEAVADPVWRQTLLNAVEGCKDGSTEFKAALAELSDKKNIRRLRVHVERSPETMIPIYQPGEKGEERAQPYKYYSLGGNYCAEIYEIKHGKNAGTWGIEIISNFHAHQKDFIPGWQKDYPTAKKVMRLQINDMVAYEEEGKTKICRVKKMTSGVVYFRDHRIAAEEADKLSWAASAAQLQKKNARKISVDITGRIKDPKAALTENKQKAA
ncbi:MAG: type II CRISPR RNA-guided endonuclease Cas9 [Alphaproteobacteria bacterium]|nr:type II CRISPR RNA-guided endonuclease Cas9 [Alphaproteobacteria bacterium]